MSVWQDLKRSTPHGATGVVSGARAPDGRLYQFMVWRRGKPLLVGAVAYESLARGVGALVHLLRFRHQFWVIVRFDADDRHFRGVARTGRDERFWRFGPFDRASAEATRTALRLAVEDGSWAPGRTPSPIPQATRGRPADGPAEDTPA